jgi:hypothetical protein
MNPSLKKRLSWGLLKAPKHCALFSFGLVMPLPWTGKLEPPETGKLVGRRGENLSEGRFQTSGYDISQINTIIKPALFYLQRTL